jgi:hypothetical protein
VDRAIIIAPNTFRAGWLDEIEKHEFRFDTHLYRSSRKKAASDWLALERHDAPPIMIVNYEAARLPNVISALVKWAKRGSCYLVIDESIQIKGYKSAQTRAVHKLAAWNVLNGQPAVCQYVRILSGRPQTQGPHDLWGQLRAIGLFADLAYIPFRGNFCVMGGWDQKEVLAAKNSEILARHMAPVDFQAKKKDWLTQPRKDFTIRDYKMSPEQWGQYAQMEEEFLLEVKQCVITVQVAIAKWTKLAQIQVGFIYDEAGNAHQLVEPEANPRLRLLRNLLEDEVEGKTIVVYRHREVLPLLLRGLTEYDPTWIKGGMRPEDIEDNKRRFNSDPQCRILLAQAEATRYGHTLLGGEAEKDKCRTMIFFENSYSADTRDQIEDRIHRRGQTGERVLYIDLSGSPLDRKIVRALQRKDALYRTVFGKLRSAEPDKPAMAEEVGP